MSYIVSKLVTNDMGSDFYLIGLSCDKKSAAELAASAYREYNRAASEQNVAMITEWLATRGEYSFRRDPKNRLQLAITELTEESGEQLVFSAKRDEDEELLRLSRALFEGKGNFSTSTQ